jgi:hypothetical protein
MGHVSRKFNELKMFEIFGYLIADSKLQIRKNYKETSCNLRGYNSYFSQPPKNTSDILDINYSISYLTQIQVVFANILKNISVSYFSIRVKFQCRK